MVVFWTCALFPRLGLYYFVCFQSQPLQGECVSPPGPVIQHLDSYFSSRGGFCLNLESRLRPGGWNHYVWKAHPGRQVPNTHPHFTDEQTESWRCRSPCLSSPSEHRAELGLPTPSPGPSSHPALSCTYTCEGCVYEYMHCTSRECLLPRVSLLLLALVDRAHICLPASVWLVCTGQPVSGPICVGMGWCAHGRVVST